MKLKTKKIAKANSLVDQVYADLRSAIIEGELEPGSRLSITALANAYEVSMIPIREALARLLTTRLVRMAANQGYFVTDALTVDDFQQLFEARRVLELAAINSGFDNIANKDIKALRKINEIMKRKKLSSKAQAGMRLGQQINTEFHCIIIDLAGNKFLSQMYRDLCFDVITSRQIPASDVQWEVITSEHDALIDALEAGDRDTAQALTTQHIESGWSMIQQSMSADS